MARGLLARVVPVVLVAGLAGGVLALPSAKGASGGAAAYDGIVHGDVLVAAAAVTACAGMPGEICSPDARARWVDADGDPATFDAAAARVDVPYGARVVHARLVWAGSAVADPPAAPGRADKGADEGADKRRHDGHSDERGNGPRHDDPPRADPPLADGACELHGSLPSGSPERQAVRVSVAGRTTEVAPGEFARVAGGAGWWYRAAADVTGAFAAVRGPVSVRVGNVWAPEGRGCFGGWAVLLAWDAGADSAPPRRVVLRDAALVAPPGGGVDLAPAGLRVAGGPVRVGVAAFEGDRSAEGDSLAVNGRRQSGASGADNFFGAPAEARTLAVDVDAVGLGVRPVRVDVRGGSDAVLVGGLALSVPLPGISVTTGVKEPQVSAGQPFDQSATVRNTGGVELSEVRIEIGPGQGCTYEVGFLRPGAGAAVGCGRTASRDLPTVTAVARGVSPDGTEVTAAAAAGMLVRAAPPPPQPPPAIVAVDPRHLPPPMAVAPRPVVPRPVAAAPAAKPVRRPVAAAAPTPGPAPEALLRPVPDRERIIVEAEGPLKSPVQTAAVIAVLGVFVMTVSVGAFSAALKPRAR